MKSNKGFFAAIGGFFKKNVYYVLLFVCVAAITAMIIIAVTYNKKSPLPTPEDPIIQQPDPQDPDPISPIDNQPMVFSLPVKEGTIGHDFSFTELVKVNGYSYRTHKGIDFHAPEGTNVYAAYEGKVSQVYSNMTEGSVVIIDHKDGVRTVYKSLADISVRVGDTVKTTDVIGHIADPVFFEVIEGPHLHFEVWQNGAIIDPYIYLLGVEK